MLFEPHNSVQEKALQDRTQFLCKGILKYKEVYLDYVKA